MTHRLPVITALAVALAALSAPALGAPAPTPTAAISGAWIERDLHYQFDIRPGANANQLVVTLPKDVQFPGDHTFVLARTGPAAFASKEQPDRPKVAVSFKSPTRGDLKIAGAGDTHAAHGGAWMMMEDFTLVRR